MGAADLRGAAVRCSGPAAVLDGVADPLRDVRCDPDSRLLDQGRNPEGHLDEPERPIYYLVGNEKPLWNPRQRLYHNFCGLLIKGVALGVLTAVPLIALSTDFTYLAFMAASASMPLCYLAAWNIPSTVKNFEQGPPLGEALYGAVIGASASVLIL